MSADELSRRVHIWCGPYGEMVLDVPIFSDQDAERIIREKLGASALDEAYGWSFAPSRELKPDFDFKSVPVSQPSFQAGSIMYEDLKVPDEYMKLSVGDDD